MSRLVSNVSGGEYCNHCGNAGFVILDGTENATTQAVAAVCPMCAKGYAISGADESLSTPRRGFTWSRGLTRHHTSACGFKPEKGFACSRPVGSGLCPYHHRVALDTGETREVEQGCVVCGVAKTYAAPVVEGVVKPYAEVVCSEGCQRKWVSEQRQMLVRAAV
jgi:hypothetical protein